MNPQPVYVYCRERSLEQLAEKVNALTKCGYHPSGDVVIDPLTRVGYVEDDRHYIQRMSLNGYT